MMLITNIITKVHINTIKPLKPINHSNTAQPTTAIPLLDKHNSFTMNLDSH